MKFFGRDDELAELSKIRELSLEHARFTVLTGRRRVGKTELVERAFNDGRTKYLYFLITRRAERDLCAILQEEASRVLSRPILGRAERFSQILEAVMLSAEDTPITLVIDEFQEFDRINPAIFGEIQGVWDRLHKNSRINLVVCGSINRMMHKIFFDDSQPLYGRNTGKIHLDPFPASLLKRILAEYNPKYTSEDLLALWTLTGGIARYVELFMDDRAFTRKAMLKTVYALSSAYIDEGRIILNEEFGKDHGVYFSILSAIAAGRTSFSEISNLIGADIGGYLTKLERSYSLISKVQPIYEKTSSKNCLYRIDDSFFRFWFRFVYKYMHLIEQKQLSELRQMVEGEFNVFEGKALESYFRAKFLEERKYTRIGGWWDRKGENEIDLVGENEFTGALDFYEIKRDAQRIDLKKLEKKVEAFLVKNPELRERNISLFAASLKDM